MILQEGVRVRVRRVSATLLVTKNLGVTSVSIHYNTLKKGDNHKSSKRLIDILNLFIYRFFVFDTLHFH